MFGTVADEADRLAALASYEICGSGPEPSLDDLASLAARITGSVFGSIMLIDADIAWLKASSLPAPASLPRAVTVCNHTIQQPDRPLVVSDLAADGRFETVVTTLGFRSYAGVPLVDRDGFALGALCVLDREPRQYGEELLDTLQTLARAVVANLELRRALLRADQAARTEPLTGLTNRRTAMSAVSAMSLAGDPLAAIVIDLDFFKETNDSAGHAAGDELLRETARRLSRVVPAGGHVARVGGDEFIVLIPGLADPADVMAIAQRINLVLHQPVPFRNGVLRLGATIGVAAFPDGETDAETLVRLADEAMLRTKRSKRGSIGLAVREDAATLTTGIAMLRAFEADIGDGGEIGHGRAALQPIVCMRGGSEPPALVAVEALARWHHPEFGTIMPNELFPLIGPERSLLLSHTVRRQALEAFRARHAQMRGARLAINLSAGEVMQADTAAELSQQVERAGLSLSDIEVEITEEVLLERVSDRALEQLAILRQRGARLVLDDFGTGSSGLSQLLRLPLDGLKLDKQFVQRLGVDLRADEIVRATLSLAHGLKLDMIAEGVETAEQEAALREIGCDAAQGFLFGRPMPPEELDAWLDRRPRPVRAARHARPLLYQPA